MALEILVPSYVSKAKILIILYISCKSAVGIVSDPSKLEGWKPNSFFSKDIWLDDYLDLINTRRAASLLKEFDNRLSGIVTEVLNRVVYLALIIFDLEVIVETDLCHKVM